MDHLSGRIAMLAKVAFELGPTFKPLTRRQILRERIRFALHMWRFR